MRIWNGLAPDFPAKTDAGEKRPFLKDDRILKTA